MDSPAGYFHWGFILISIPNLVLIIVMLGLFLLAAFSRMPGHEDEK